MNINNVEYILQPDIERRGEIIQSIRDNDGYCPCVVQKTPDTKCICKNFRTTGECHCGLWVKKEE